MAAHPQPRQGCISMGIAGGMGDVGYSLLLSTPGAASGELWTGWGALQYKGNARKACRGQWRVTKIPKGIECMV